MAEIHKGKEDIIIPTQLLLNKYSETHSDFPEDLESETSYMSAESNETIHIPESVKQRIEYLLIDRNIML